MMRLFGVTDGALVRLGDDRLGPEVLWIDLCDPTQEEEDAVEAMLDVEVPTLQEMAEIEESSRLYREDGALIVTATGSRRTGNAPFRAPLVTFVVTPRPPRLGALRQPLGPFRTFEAKCCVQPELGRRAPRLCVPLIDSIV